MAEVAVQNDQQAASKPATMSIGDIPTRKTLLDGSHLLAETSAFLVLENNVHTKKCGSLVNEHTVQLIRTHRDPTTGRPDFKLVVKPREGEAGDVEQSLLLDTRCSMTPALRRIRRETHFVKPDGEGLARSINNLDGKEIKLYVFEVSRGCGNPFLDLLRLRRTTLRLGFTSSQEALGWYVYAAACARIMSDADPDFSKVIKQQQGLAEHAAAPHALILEFDETPAAPARAAADAASA